MNIADMQSRGKAALARIPKKKAFTAGLFLLAVGASFGLGITVGKGEVGAFVETQLPGAGSAEPVVAPRDGNAYYFPWCAGADRVRDANKIWFQSAGAAEAAGYSPGKGCAGL